MVQLVTDGIAAFLDSRDMVDDAREAVSKPSSNPEKAKVQAIRKEIKQQDETARHAPSFMKKFILNKRRRANQRADSQSPAQPPPASLTKQRLAQAAGSAVPIVGTILDGIDTAEAIYESGKLIKMAHLQNTIGNAADDMDDDPALVKSYENRAGRATNRAVKKSLHAASKVVQTAGSATISSGVGAPSVGLDMSPAAQNLSIPTRPSSKASIGARPKGPRKLWNSRVPAATRRCKRFLPTIRSTPQYRDEGCGRRQ